MYVCMYGEVLSRVFNGSGAGETKQQKKMSELLVVRMYVMYVGGTRCTHEKKKKTRLQ